jgi:predicted RNA-binding protein associated with RNAse of E/G family
LRSATQNLRGGAPHKYRQPTSEIKPTHTSAYHSRIRPRPAHPSGASRAHPHLSSLHVFTRAQRTRVHFCTQDWLLCHLGLYSFEFEFERKRLRM